MLTSIVLFGPAEVGKSTLGGLFIAKNMTEEEYARKQETIKKELHARYNKKQALAYLMDTTNKERTRENKRVGSSEYIRYLEMNNYGRDLLIIDTPGKEHKLEATYIGVSAGTIGVFMIDAISLIKGVEDSNKFIFTDLYLLITWKMQYSSKNLIIAVTKVDLAIERYSAKSYLLAVAQFIKIIKQLDIDISKEVIIPIYVDIAKRRGYNIFESDNLCGWSGEHSLLDKLYSVVERLEYHDAKYREKFATVIQTFPNAARSGSSWDICIKEGSISKGETVMISPIKKNSYYQSVKMHIKSLKNTSNEERDRTDVESFAGSISGIQLSGYEINQMIMKNTCIFGENNRTLQGNVIRFSLISNQPLLYSSDIGVFDRENLAYAFEKITIGQELIWIFYGNKIVGNIIDKLSEKSSSLTKYYLTVEFTVPFEVLRSHYAKDEIFSVLLNHGGIQNNKTAFVTIDKIGYVKEFTINCNDELLNKKLIQNLKRYDKKSIEDNLIRVYVDQYNRKSEFIMNLCRIIDPDLQNSNDININIVETEGPIKDISQSQLLMPLTHP